MSVGNFILIIEDSIEIQELIHLLYKSEGFEVQCASNGAEALLKLRASPELPFLILLDLMMPVMDGFQFRTEQQKDPKLSAIPVIVMTADSNAEAKSVSMGVQGYLKKPVDVVDLLAAAEEYRQKSENSLISKDT